MALSAGHAERQYTVLLLEEGNAILNTKKDGQMRFVVDDLQRSKINI
jgi:hypothetical protein